MGKKQESYHFRFIYVILLIASIVAWYVLCFIGEGSWLILLSWIPLMGITRYMLLVCKAPLFQKLYNKRIVGDVVFIVSQLCLESYLIQSFIISDKLNALFPLNIPVMMIIILIAAYITKTLAEFILQTFRTEPYDWSIMLLRRRGNKGTI